MYHAAAAKNARKSDGTNRHADQRGQSHLKVCGHATVRNEPVSTDSGHRFPEGRMHDLRWAVRSVRKQPGFTALAIFTLALGVGATTTAFTVLDTVLLRPLPYEASDRLVLMRERTVEGRLIAPSYPNFSDWRDQAKSFSGVASESYAPDATVSVGKEPVRVAAIGVSRRFFKILGVRLTVGREFNDAENKPGGPDAVVVSYEFWRAHMDGRLPLGTIQWGKTPVPVVGVLPRGFRFVDDVDIYYPRRDGTLRQPLSPDEIDHRLAQNLLDRFVAAGAQMIFVGFSSGLHGPTDVVIPYPNHENHMHVRFPPPGG